MSQPSLARRLEPMLLLFAAGFCIGLIFPLGKLAAGCGLSPLVYAGTSAAGASLVLAVLSALAGQRITANAETLRYAVIAGQITFAIPFGTLVVVIPHLGSGIPAIIQSLAPVITLGIVYALGLERPNLYRALGLAVGMAGALIILFARNSGGAGTHAAFGWYLMALVTPLALAAANVFRSTHWPKGHGPLPLATLTLAAAAAGIAILLAVLHVVGTVSDLSTGLASGWYLIVAQSVATGIGYAFFFRLQQVGGPVYLSQISYVNTGVGVAFAVLLFAEKLSLWTWLAVALVLVGVAMVNRARAS
jgi:drug/metabolite transporter (DMT)-like permease